MKRKQIKEANSLSLFSLFDVKKIIYLSVYLFYCICRLLRDENTIPTSLDDIREITNFEDENKEIVVALLACKSKKIEILALDKTRTPRTIVLGINYEILPHPKIIKILIE